MKVVHVLFVLLIIVFALSNFLQAQQEQQHSLDGITWENLQQSYSVGLNSRGLSSDEEVDDFLLNFMEMNHIPGMSVSIVKYGDVAWARGYGFASFNPPIPVTKDTLFMLASVSKPITGTALMKLYDEGKFNLSDPVNNYLPFGVNHPLYPTKDITFHMLLTHTSGIQDNWSVMPTIQGDPPFPLNHYLQNYLCPGGGMYYPASNYTGWEPGTQYEYSNVGATLVGYLVETISGTSFEQYCQQNLFVPLGMNETSWFVSNLNPLNIAMPYNWTGSAYSPYGHYSTWYYPSGQLRTSAPQLSRFLATFMENRSPLQSINDIQILQGTTAIMMTTPQIPQLDSYTGLLWVKFIDGYGNTYWGHDGSFYGVTTQMWYCMDTNVGVIILCNKRPVNPVDLYVVLEKLFYYFSVKY